MSAAVWNPPPGEGRHDADDDPGLRSEQGRPDTGDEAPARGQTGGCAPEGRGPVSPVLLPEVPYLGPYCRLAQESGYEAARDWCHDVNCQSVFHPGPLHSAWAAICLNFHAAP